MTSAEWERTKAITADALELEPEARAGYIAAACVNDPAVCREVMRLVAESVSSTQDFLSSPPVRLMHLFSGQAPTFLPGQQIGARFRVERFISRGGMGEVYAAADLELQETVALKTIRSAISHSPAAIDSFKREVSQSRRITHPNVCRVHDIFMEELGGGDPVWFLTMELLSGRTLSQRIESEGPLDSKEALPIIRNLIDAIAAAHQLKIVHRDLKPNNVMLIKAGKDPERAVVMDFGLALKVSAGGLTDGDGAGTPAYRSPEQTRREAATLASDQYSLGLVICKMLTATVPQLSHTSAAESRRQVRAWLRMQPRRRINFHLRRVISRCLRFRPVDRFGDVREILPVMEGRRLRLLAWRGAIAAGILTMLTGVILASAPYLEERVTAAVPLTSETGIAAGANISSNGKWIVYQSDSGQQGNMDIWIEPASGGARRLTTNPAIDSDPAVSPDGRSIIFRSERDGGGLFAVDADGTGEHLLVSGGRNPEFSPDGRWIAYWTGTRDDVSPSGELYRIAPEGGSPVRLAASFADARYPTWSPDGKFILFDGCQSGAATLNSCNDWWVIAADGSGAKRTGAAAIIRSRTIELQGQPTKTWRKNEIIFSAASGSAVPLWAVALSPATHRAEGVPRRITEGDARERDPEALNDGTIVFGRVTGALHVWQLSLRSHGDIESRRVTNDAGLDGCPGVSRDGRWLYLTRKTDGIRHLVVTDLATGLESPLRDISDDDEFWPVPSASGSVAAVETRGRAIQAIWVVPRSGRGRRLCSGCSHPTSWFDDRAVLYATPRGEIAEVDASTGKSRIILWPESGAVLGGADWNAAQGYLLFTSTRHGSERQTFAIRYSSAADRPAGEWIPISAGSAELEQPHWSTDGSAIYFLSKLDGNDCVWGLRFDATRQRIVGAPFSVMHFHDSRRTPDMAAPISRGLTVAPDSVFLNVGEVTDTVWRGRLADPPWFIGLLFRK